MWPEVFFQVSVYGDGGQLFWVSVLCNGSILVSISQLSIGIVWNLMMCSHRATYAVGEGVEYAFVVCGVDETIIAVCRG